MARVPLVRHPCPKVFSLKIRAEPSQITLPPAWCSKLRLTTGVQLAPCHDEFRGPRSDGTTFYGGTVIYANVSCYLKSREQRELVDRRRADTEKVQRLLIFSGLTEFPATPFGSVLLYRYLSRWGYVVPFRKESSYMAKLSLEAQSCQVIYSQFGLAIHQNDHQARRRFVEWAQNEIAVVTDFHKRILFSDEAHFWFNSYVNKQNCRIRSEANPQVYVETPLHPEKLTVWCALWAGGIIGSYFFKNDEGHNVTVNGDRYRAMITNFFITELNNHDVQELWFQQDGATCHTARATIDLLKDTFGDHLISRFGPVNWPPRSCYLL
ncbi:uncharacterized protein TNCV_1440641 [Trichonephila clavipes]|nr:uncharacterized protein TNCV_1440641 [Trichonephila clavipes]